MSKKKQKLYEKFIKTRNEKNEKFINLTKVFLSPVNGSLKGFIIRVKYWSLKTTQRKHVVFMKEVIGKIRDNK